MTAIWLPMPDNLALTPNEVHLFLVSTDLPSETIAHLETLLSVDERQKIARFRIPAKRTESIISRAVLRFLLARFLKTPTEKIRLAANAHGKPHLENHLLHFNLSHTAGHVLLAISFDHEVGVDIESLRPDLQHEDLARRFFTASEHAALVALPLSDRLSAFFRCWTRKEAILKATGRGISFGLDTFEVPIHASASPIHLDGWILHDIPVPSTHVASLAIGAAAPEIHYWTLFENPHVQRRSRGCEC